MTGIQTGGDLLIGGRATQIQQVHRFTEARTGHRHPEVTRLAFLTKEGLIFITTDIKYEGLRRNTPPELYTNRTVNVADRGNSRYRLDIAAARETWGEYARSYVDLAEWGKWWHSERRDGALEETSMNVRRFDGEWGDVLAGRAEEEAALKDLEARFVRLNRE